MRERLLQLAGLSLCLALTNTVSARPRENPHDDRRDRHEEDARRHDPRPDERDQRRDTNAPARLEAPPAVPPAAPAAQTAEAERRRQQYLQHLVQKQQQERALHKTALKDAKSWNDARAQRAQERRNDIVQTYGTAAETPQAKAELAMHADRMARLNRALDIAEEKGDSALVNRTNDLINREIARDARAMAEIQGNGAVR